MTPKHLSLLRLAALVLACLILGVIALAALRSPFGVPATRVTGTADVGGPFELINHLGERVSDQTLRGQSLIIYFGWTLDPDLTPAALQILSSALQRLGPKSQGLTPVFISLDPERDKTHILKAYLARFDQRMIGLTGTTDQTIAIAKAYKLYHKQLPDAALPGGYSIDHASLYYVMGTDGRFRGGVPHTTDSAALAKEIQNLTN